MNITISGASGLIGRRLLKNLLSAGHSVHVLSRHAGTNLPPGVKLSAWDPVKGPPPEESLRDAGAVIHLAGEPVAQRWNEDVKRRIRESRERATKNLVDALSATDPRPPRLVSQSAVGYYGDRGDALVDESTAPGDSFDAQVCVAWEAAALAAEEVGVRVAIIRSGLVLDPGHGLLKQLLLPFKLGMGGPIAGGAQYMSWIHIGDEVRLLLWALDTDGASGAYSSTSPNPVTNGEFAKTLGRVLGRPAVLRVPKAALKLRFGDELGEVVASGQRVIPRRALDGGFEFAHPELEGALRDLLTG